MFSFKLNYNTVTKKNINTNVIEKVNDSYNQTVKKLYNGNIAETYWRTSSDNTLRKYSYAYDNLNRLLAAHYQKPEAHHEQTASYDENLSYDKNGNIARLSRTGEYDDMVQNLTIDELEYTYENNNSNRLVKVYDASTNPNGFKDGANTGNDYSYDANGNMIVDHNKGITSIRYNHLNLPTIIDFGPTGNIQYIYNASGVKVRKIVREGNETYTTDYLNGFQYLNSRLEFFPHAEGYVKVTKTSNNYVFNYTDHLGNVRLSYTKDPNTNVLTVLEENNYYPFGLKHRNYNMGRKQYLKLMESGGIEITPTNETIYDYKYNGKEWQDELGLNMYAMDMRMYDPAIARWVVQDPITHYDFSPYSAFDNNPVFWADPTGADSETDFSGRAKYDRWGMYIPPNERGQADYNAQTNGISTSSNGNSGSAESLASSMLSNTKSESHWMSNGDGSFSGFEGDSFFDIAQSKDGQYKLVDIFSKNTQESFENLLYNISKFVKENGTVNKSVYITDIIQNTLSSSEKAGWNIIDKTIKYNNVEVQIVAQFPKGDKELSKVVGITAFMDKVYSKNSNKGYVNMHGIALLSNHREMLRGAQNSYSNVRLLQIKSFNRQIIQTISDKITKP